MKNIKVDQLDVRGPLNEHIYYDDEEGWMIRGEYDTRGYLVADHEIDATTGEWYAAQQAKEARR